MMFWNNFYNRHATDMGLFPESTNGPLNGWDFEKSGI
jgi:hypothetical protein